MAETEHPALLCWWCLSGHCLHDGDRPRVPDGHEMPAAAITDGHSICVVCAAAKERFERQVRYEFPLPGEEDSTGRPTGCWVTEAKADGTPASWTCVMRRG